MACRGGYGRRAVTLGRQLCCCHLSLVRAGVRHCITAHLPATPHLPLLAHTVPLSATISHHCTHPQRHMLQRTPRPRRSPRTSPLLSPAPAPSTPCKRLPSHLPRSMMLTRARAPRRRLLRRWCTWASPCAWRQMWLRWLQTLARPLTLTLATWLRQVRVLGGQQLWQTASWALPHLLPHFNHNTHFSIKCIKPVRADAPAAAPSSCRAALQGTSPAPHSRPALATPHRQPTPSSTFPSPHQVRPVNQS